MLSDDVYDALVAHVYRAGQGEGSWEDLLDALALNLDCWSAHLMGFDPTSGTMIFGHDGGSPPAEASLDYIREWHRCDPRNAVLMRVPPDTWVHCHEHLSEEFVATDRFYQDFLIPYGSRFVSGAYFTASPDLICIFSFHRGIRQQPFNSDE